VPFLCSCITLEAGLFRYHQIPTITEILFPLPLIAYNHVINKTFFLSSGWIDSLSISCLWQHLLSLAAAMHLTISLLQVSSLSHELLIKFGLAFG